MKDPGFPNSWTGELTQFGCNGCFTTTFGILALFFLVALIGC
jgi:hypothetical protein